MKKRFNKVSGKRILALVVAAALACPTWNLQASSSTEPEDIKVSSLESGSLDQYTSSGTSCTFDGDYPAYHYGDATSTSYAGAKEGQSIPGKNAENDLKTYVFSNTYNGAYLSYLKALEDAGWKQYSNNIIEDTNLFATYTKDDDGDGNEDRSIYAYYIANKKQTYLVTSENCVFENIEAENEYETVCSPQLTQLILRADGVYQQGMSYVLRLSDGRFIIVDGGFNEEGHAEELYALLEEQNVLDKITIAAWFITHPHKDHVGTAAGFLGKYTSVDVTIEEMIFNFSTYDDACAEDSDTWEDDDQAYSRVQTLIENAETWQLYGMKIVTCHTGQEYYLADATIEILHTIEDYYPNGVNDIDANVNDSSVAFRIKIGGQTILMTGDCAEYESTDLVTMWGDYLKSDIMQLPHHGNLGGTIELYECVDAQVVMIPAMRGAISSISKIEATKWILDNTGGNIEEVILQGYAQRTIELPYTPAEDTEYLSGSDQNGYVLKEAEKTDAEVPDPYMDLVFDGDAVANGGTGYNTLTMNGGSVGTNTVVYKGETYDVTSYRGEQGTDDYIHVTMEDIANATALKELLLTDGFTFEMFMALDDIPTATYNPLLANTSGGGMALAVRKSTGVLNFQMCHTTTDEDGSTSYAYTYAVDTSVTNNTTANMVGGSIVTHVVGTFDPTKNMMYLYRNGVLISSIEFDEDTFKESTENVNQLGIGKSVAGTMEALASETGYTVMRSRVYDTCLTEEQVAAEYWDCIDMLGADIDETVTELSNGAISKQYDISEYRMNKKTETIEEVEVTYYTDSPEAPRGYSGYIFAGWYSDVNCTSKNVLTDNNVTSGIYYAKFVPDDILSLKAQIKSSTGYTSESGVLRFVTSVDSLNYAAVGFDVVVDGVIKSAQSDTVCRELRAESDVEGKTINYTPSKTFHEMSKYFLACSVVSIQNKDFGHGYIVTPYWITRDGTKVSGVTDTKTVNMGYVPKMITAEVESAFSLSHAGTNSWFSTYTTQGSCTDGTYYYQAEFLDNTWSTDYVYIHKYNITDMDKIVAEDGSPVRLSISEVNDITYNETLGRIVACSGSQVSIINPDSLSVESTTTIDVTASGIDYNAFNEKYVVSIDGGESFCILNSEFKVVGRVYSRTDDATSYTEQGIASDDSYIYISHTDKNMIAVYDWSGNYVTMIDLTSSGVALADIEGVVVYDNEMYITCNDSSSTSVYKVTSLTKKEETAYLAEIRRDDATYSYTSLEAAMLDAGDNETIVILDDVTVKSTMEMLADNVTITNAAGTNVTIITEISDAMIENRGSGFTIKAAEGTTLTIESETGILNYKTVVLSGAVIGLNVTEGAETAVIKLATDYDASSSKVTVTPTVAKDHQLVSGSTEHVETIVLAAGSLAGAWSLDNTGWLRQEGCVSLQSTGAKYNSLAKAVAAADENDTITVLNDFTLDENIEITKSLTITSESEATITRIAGLTGDMFDVTAGTLTITNIVIDGNAGSSAEKTRAIKVEAGATLDMTNAAIQNFYSSNSGGAIYSAGEKVTLNNVAFYNNKGTQAGAIHLYVKSSSETLVLSATDCKFEGNESTKGTAGALFLRAKGKTVEFTNSTDDYANAYFNSDANVASVYANTTFKISGYDFNGSQVNLLDAKSYVNLSGKIAGLKVQYSAEAASVEIGGALDVASDITLVPVTDSDGNYTENVQLVTAASGVDNETFKAATKVLQVAADAATGAWAISEEGYLVQDECIRIDSTQKEYYSLSAAVADATEGDTITILRSFTMVEGVTIDKTLTITSEDAVTITRGANLTGDMFDVTSGTLTIQGSIGSEIVLDGNCGSTAIDVRAVDVASGATFKMTYGTIQNFYSNRTYAGTAVYSAGTVELTNVNLTNDRTTTTSAGGAIRNQSGTLTITDSVISGCSNKGDGGAVYTNNKNVTIKGCTFTGNRASTRGGAIYSNTSGITITECTFTNNSASYGGAIAVNIATIDGATFESNIGSKKDGDVYLINETSCVTLSGTITGLTVTYTGDAVGIKLADDFKVSESGVITICPSSYQGDIKVVDVVTTDSTILSSAVNAELFAVSMQDGTEGCTLSSEGYLEMPCVAIGETTYTSLANAITAANSGDTITILRDFTLGTCITVNKDIKITSSEGATITRAASFAGNMFDVTSGTLTIEGSEGNEIIIDGNAGNTEVAARAVEVASGATFKMTYGTIQNFNSSLNAVAVYNKGTTELTNVTIQDNVTTSGSAGGAIRNENAELTMTNTVISNTTSSYYGGALYASGNSARVTIDTCTFTGNTAKRGGAIYYNDASGVVSILNSSFNSNSATEHAGAIDVRTATITDCTFGSNTVGDEEVDVYLLDGGTKAAITISGKLTGLTVKYTSNDSKVKIGGAIDTASDITIIPASYTEGAQVVSKASDSVDDDTLKAATKLIQVTPDETTGEWAVNESGCLAQYQAQIGDIQYSTLAEAVNAAADGATIKILCNFTLTTAIDITKSLTLTSDKEVMITRATDLTGNMFTVNAGTTFTIQGTEDAQIIIDGNAGDTAVAARAIYVAPSEAADEEAGTEAKAAGKLVMEYATIQNFYNADANGTYAAGAAIWNAGVAEITNVTISNNDHAGSTSGGAIRNQNAKITITDTVFIGNNSKYLGGAFYVNNVVNDEDVKLIRCTFKENSGTNGGAIYYNDAKPIIMEDCTFTGNTATGNGGAIDARKLVVTNATFASNTASGAGNDVCSIKYHR